MSRNVKMTRFNEGRGSRAQVNALGDFFHNTLRVWLGSKEF